MASVTAAASGFAGVGAFEPWDADQPSVLMLIACWLLLGAGVRSLPLAVQRLLPYTVLVLLAGCGLGVLAATCSADSPACYPYRVISERAPYPGISPTMLQLALLLPLVFAELFHTDIYMFRKVMSQTLLLAFPGMLFSAVLMCAFVVALRPQYFDWATGMMFGTMMAASDPAAVLVGMKELGADPRLAAIISGESIMNDGCAIVLFTLLYGAAFQGRTFTAGSVMTFAAAETVGAAALGVCFLVGSLLLLQLCRKEMPVVLTTVIAIPFTCFYAAMLLGTSGFLAMVPLSLGLRFFSRSFLPGHLAHVTHTVWELIEFMANTFVFLISGVIMVMIVFSSDITGSDAIDLIYVYLASLATRGITILTLYPLLRRMGLGFNAADALVTWWGGLKGAGGLSIAMIVHFSANRGHPLEQTGVRFMFHMSGVYFLTAIINATLSTPLVRYLKLDAKPHARLLAMVEVSDACCQHAAGLVRDSQGAESKAAAKARELCDKFHVTVCMASAGAILGEEGLLEAGGHRAIDWDGERRRVLEACTRRYDEYSEAGMICNLACAALDHVTKDAALGRGSKLQRWSALGPLCSGLRRLSSLPFGLGTCCLALSAEIAWGFAEAQDSVREALRRSPVMAEASGEAVGARTFLESLGVEHPGALRRMKAQHLAATARCDALRGIHRAASDGSLHADEVTILEEVAQNLAEGIKHIPVCHVKAVCHTKASQFHYSILGA